MFSISLSLVSSSKPLRKLLIPEARSPIKFDILPLPKKIKTRTTTIKILKKFAEKPVAVGSAAVTVVDSETITISDPSARVDIIVVGKDTAEDY